MEKILYVDDEEVNVATFTMSFEDEFEVVACRSGEEALRKFKECDDVAVVVSDQRMPGMSGVELLTEIYHLNPEPIRIVLTAYSESRDIIDAINKGHIYQYIQKPWNLEDLRQRLHGAVDMFRLAQDNKQLFAEIEKKNSELFKANEQLQKDIDLQANLEKQRRVAELKLLSQSKLASLGEIATGIAHELNQPITFIKIIIESALRDLRENRLDHEELTGDMEESHKQVERITTIINHLRTFGRADTMDTGPVLLSDVLRNSLILFNKRISDHHIKLSFSIDDQLSVVSGNSSQLEQVMINLFQNSIDALEGIVDPEIKISMRDIDNSVQLIFSDNGQGMTADVAERIFEPFYTTKEVGKGTGVGLSIAWGIINEHNGTISCDSSPGNGAVFTIALPRSG